MKLLTEVVPIHVLAIARFQTAGSAEARACDASSPHPAEVMGLEPADWQPSIVIL